MKEHIDHARLGIEAIDRGLNAPAISVPEAIAEAVVRGRMTAEEADECMRAFEQTISEVPPELDWVGQELRRHGSPQP